MQMALSACVFDGVFDRFRTLRMGFLERAAAGWPDLVTLSRALGRSASATSTRGRISITSSCASWSASVAGDDGRLHLLAKARGVYDLLVHAARERPRRTRRLP